MEKTKYTSPTEDISQINLGDKRLDKRLVNSIDARMHFTKQTRGSAKGFYRLLSNDKFNSEKLRVACFHGTAERIKGLDKVLLVQDSTDINLNGHKKTRGLGYSSNNTKGIQAHSCLAVSTSGIPMGLLYQGYETRPEKKSTMSESQKKSRPIEEKESNRWLETLQESIKHMPSGVEAITVCDREGDIFELYEQANELDTGFVIRSSYDRKTETSEKLFARIRKAPVLGYVIIDIPRDSRKNIKARKARMAVSSCSVDVSKKQNQLPLNIVRIVEVGEAESPIEWMLATNLPIDDAEAALEIVGYYVQRWKIERFHYVLKSGCKVEEIQQRTVERILPVIFICSMIANFILAMTYLGRELPDVSCDTFFEEADWKLLYRFAKKTKTPPDSPYPLSDAIIYLGLLGIGKRPPSDGVYGVKALWLGLSAFYSAVEIFVGQV